MDDKSYDMVYVGKGLEVDGSKIHQLFNSTIQGHIDNIVNTFGLEYSDFVVEFSLRIKKEKLEKFTNREYPVYEESRKVGNLGRLQHDDPVKAGEYVVECENELKEDYPDLYDNIRDTPSYQDAFELVAQRFGWKYPPKILYELTTKIRN